MGVYLTRGYLPGARGCTWSWGVYMLGACTCLGVPAWSWGVYLVPEGCTCPGGVPAEGSTCLGVYTCLVPGGVPAWRASTCWWCNYWGVYLPGGTCLVPGGVPGPGGCTLPVQGGVPAGGVPARGSARGGTCLVPGGVPGPGGCTCTGGVPAGGVYLPEGYLPRYSPLWTEFLTHACENITLPKTSFAGGNDTQKRSELKPLKVTCFEICTKESSFMFLKAEFVR